MPIAISSREDKDEQVDLLRRLVQRYLFPGMLNMKDRHAVLEHLEWIKRQRDIIGECKLETVPELQMTRFTLTITHTPQGKVKQHA